MNSATPTKPLSAISTQPGAESSNRGARQVMAVALAAIARLLARQAAAEVQEAMTACEAPESEEPTA